MNKIELLAPAGSLEALEAAVESGADAVYIGGSRFNARAYADNLDAHVLKSAVEYAHLRNVKVYVTVNILILHKELAEVLEYVRYLYCIDVDAVIVQDIGLCIAIRKLFPALEVHCSTQMTIHNTDGARLMKQLGVNRVVFSRELSLNEVNNIVENSGVEAEVFVHGALCVCYSGQCYMSSLIGGRSGNRGKCAQPCRRKYRLYDINENKTIGSDKGAYLISTKDLNTYQKLQSIQASNITSLKIEGRMKRPEYVAIVVHHYREALDCITSGSLDCISDEAIYELKIAFNREFTEGYLFEKRNQDIVSIQRPDNRGVYLGKVLNQKGNIAEILLEDNFLNDGDGIEIIDFEGNTTGAIVSGIRIGKDIVKTAVKGDIIRIFTSDRVAPKSTVNKTLDNKLFKKAREEYSFKNKRKVLLYGSFTGIQNQVPALELWDDQSNYIRVEGYEAVQQAEKLAISEEKILEQLNKTKDTPYSFVKLDINIEPGSFLSVKAINSLRREALESLSQKRISSFKRIVPVHDTMEAPEGVSTSKISQSGAADELIAGIRDLGAGLKAIEAGADSLYVLGNYRYEENYTLMENLYRHCISNNIGLFYVLPQITHDRDHIKLEGVLQRLLDNYKEIGLVISNISQVMLAAKYKPSKLRGNFTINALNGYTADFLSSNGIESICASPEMNLSQIKDLKQASSIQLEAMVYGYIPAMVTEYCPHSNTIDCNHCEGRSNIDYGIQDDKNKLFKILKLGNCMSLILNSDVLCVYDNLSNILESGASKLRLDFYSESDNEIYDIIKAYKEKSDNPLSNEEKEIIKRIKANGFTKGHYFRGID